MQRITLALAQEVDGVPIDEVPFKVLQKRVNQAVPGARWAYLGFLGDRFCMDTVVSENKLAEIQAQVRDAALIEGMQSEPWPAGPAR